MRYFNHDHVDAVADIMLSVELGEPFSAAAQGKMGGIKRRARTRMVLDFCDKLRFADISLTSMQLAQRIMFDRAVAHADLLKWATPGRKADSRVDMSEVEAFAVAHKPEAALACQAFEEEWNQVKKLASGKAGVTRSAERKAQNKVVTTV